MNLYSIFFAIISILLFSAALVQIDLISIDEWVYLYHIIKIDISEYWIPSYAFFFLFHHFTNFSNWYFFSKIFNIILWLSSNYYIYHRLKGGGERHSLLALIAILSSAASFYTLTFTPETLSLSLFLLIIPWLLGKESVNVPSVIVPLMFMSKMKLGLALPALFLGYLVRRDFWVTLIVSLSAIICISVLSQNSGSGYLSILRFPDWNVVQSFLKHLLVYCAASIVFFPSFIDFRKVWHVQKAFCVFAGVYSLSLIIVAAYFTVSANLEQAISGVKLHERYIQSISFVFLSFWFCYGRRVLSVKCSSKLFFVVWFVLVVLYLLWGRWIPLSKFDAPFHYIIHQSDIGFWLVALAFLLAVVFAWIKDKPEYLLAWLIGVQLFGLVGVLEDGGWKYADASRAALFFGDYVPDRGTVGFENDNVVDRLRFSFFMLRSEVVPMPFDSVPNFVVTPSNVLDESMYCSEVLASSSGWTLCRVVR